MRGARDVDADEPDPAVYGAWFRSELGRRVWKDERRALDQSLGEVAGRSVLDVGAGEGRLARELSSQGARVVTLDRSEAMLRAGEYAGEGPHPEPVRGDAMALPFADESFDVVVAVTVLCFIEREADMAHELARVTKVGGRVVLGELGRWSTWALARRVGAWLKGGHPDRAAEVEAHLSACPACRAREAFERQLRDRLQELRTAPVPSRLKVRVDVILARALNK